MAALLKTVYRPFAKIEAFYSGGPAVLSPDGELLACACYDDIKIVLAATGKTVQTLPGDTEPVTALTFGPTGDVLFSVSRSLQNRCWDTAAGLCTRVWKGHTAAVAHLAVDASGGMLASGSADRTIRVWNTAGFHCTHVLRGHSTIVLRVIFQSQELNLISAAEDGEIRVWDLVRHSCTAKLKAHFSAITALSLTADGRTLLSAGRDKVATLWDLRTHSKLSTIPVFEAVEVVDHPVATHGAAVQAFAGAQVLPLSMVSNQQIASAEEQKTGRAWVLFATAGEKGIVRVWNSASGQCILQQVLQGPFEEGSQLINLALSCKGEMMATTADSRISFLAIEPADAGVASQMGVRRELVGHQGEVTDLALFGRADEAEQLVVSTNSAIVRVYDIATCSCQAVLHGHSDVVLALDTACLGAGTTLLVTGSKDCTFRLWHLRNAREDPDSSAAAHLQCTLLAATKGHTAAVTAVALGKVRPGHLLVSASTDRMLKVWDTAPTMGGKDKRPASLQSVAAVQAHDKDINSVVLSPNDSLICTTSQDRSAKVWHLPSLVLSLSLTGHRRGVWAAAFSPVEQAIATASGDKTMRIWSLKNGSCLRTLQGHTGAILRLLYLPSGVQVVSSGADGLVKLWNIRTGECMSSLEEHEGKVWALAKGGTSQCRLASGGADATICIWEDASQQQREETVHARNVALEAQVALSNALQDGKLAKAAAIAFRLNKPQQLLAIIEKAQENDACGAAQLLNSLVAGFTPDDIKKAFEISRDWNTHAQHCHHAQELLQAILLSQPPKVLEDINGLQDVLASINPYTQRHIARMERLLCNSYILDYTLSRLQNIDPLIGEVAGAM